MKFSLTLLFTFSVLVVSAQITLEPCDEPGKSGTKSILFEYVDEVTGEKVKKEFDIQENNPMNKRGYQKKEEKRGNIIYSLTSAQVKGYLNEIGLPETLDIPNEDLSSSAWSWVYSNKSYASVIYISGLASGNEPIEITRSSDLFVLDNKGNEVIRLEKLPYDVFDMVISENGRYLTYLKGSSGAHTLFDTVPGLVIRKLDDGTIFYERNISVQTVGSTNGWTMVGAFSDGQYRAIVLNESSGYMYYRDFKAPYPSLRDISADGVITIVDHDGSKGEISINSFNRLK